MDAPLKEPKAQRAERLKQERNPWEILPDLMRYAQSGFESIPEDDLSLRFRRWGLYTQGTGKARWAERCRTSWCAGKAGAA